MNGIREMHIELTLFRTSYYLVEVNWHARDITTAILREFVYEWDNA